MKRIEPVQPGTRPELAQQEAKILAERGRVSELYQVLLNSPPICHGWEQMLSAVRNYSSLSADVRELVILRVAILNHAPYEFDAHVPHALNAGVSEQTIDALKSTEYKADHSGFQNVSHLLTPIQQIALKLTDTMTKEIVVPDALFAQVMEHFNPQGRVDLVATIGAYNMVSRFLQALHVGH